MKKKKKTKGRILWIFLICVILLGAGFYFRRQIRSELNAYGAKPSPVLSTANDRRSKQSSPKPEIVGSTKGKFTFFPDDKNQYAWSVRYPDNRVFNLGDEFSSDCTPTITQAKAPETVRFEFNEQRSCDSNLRKSIQVDAGAVKDVNRDGSPEVISVIVTGGNVYGHTSSLISLTPKGPKVIRHLE